MRISNLEITERFWKKPSSATLIIRKIETEINVSTLYASGLKVKNVNIIHKWFKS